MQELVAYAKANPDKANAAATGPIFQVVQKMFEQRTGTHVRIHRVPRQFGSDAGADARRRADVAVGRRAGDRSVAGRPRARAGGDLAAAAASHPDVPTMAEQGFKDMEVEFWTGLLAPAKTPPAIVKRLQDEIMAIVKLPDVVEKLAAHQTYPAGNTAEEFATIIARELVQWGEVAKKGNIKIE